MEQAIEQSRCDDGIAEDLTPFGKAAVGCEDHCPFLVAGVDELEEQIAAAGHDGQITDFVDNQEGWSAEEADALLQAALAFGAGKCGDELGERREVDALAGLVRRRLDYLQIVYLQIP